MPLVLDLQRKAIDQATSLPELLRFAKLVAAKLRLDGDLQWINAELDGYGQCAPDELPPYRVIQGDLVTHNPYNGLTIPIRYSDTKNQLLLEKIQVGDSLASLQQLLQSEGDYISYKLPHTVATIIRESQGEWVDPVRRVGRSQIQGLLDSVRNRVLSWSLDLEARGIHGNDMTFTESEVQKAQAMTQQIHIASFQGVLATTVTGGHVNIDNTDSTIASLTACGVDEAAKQELKQLLVEYREAGSSAEKSGISARAGKWIEKHGALIGGLAKVVAGWFQLNTG